jgi:hypothetical protein
MLAVRTEPEPFLLYVVYQMVAEVKINGSLIGLIQFDGNAL